MYIQYTYSILRADEDVKGRDRVFMETLTRRERERQTRKDEIVAAAERVFCQKGFEGASMDEIAKEAQFTKRTVYQYFLNKEDLFYAVRLKGRRQLFQYLKAAIERGSTGFERIHLAAEAYYQFYRDHPDILRLMNYTEQIGANEEANPRRQELLQFGRDMFVEFAEVIEAGKADGSIRDDLDAKIAAPAIAFVLNGFFHMLAEVGEAFTGILDLNPEGFVRFTLSLIDSALRPG